MKSRLRAGVSALLVGIAISCGDGTDSESLESVPSITPFDSLAGLRLPITLRDLAKARPRARPTDFGLRERVGGVVISYFADREIGSEDHPPPKARVGHIEADWGSLSDDSTTNLWRGSLARLTSVLGVSPECLRASQTVVYARWRSPSAAVAYLRGRHSVTGPVRQSASFSIGFTVDTTTVGPELTGAAPTSCEDPFRS